MGSQSLWCPHLYRDLAPSQHPRSIIALDDRTQDCGKTGGRRTLCVYINDTWCSNVVKSDGQCFQMSVFNIKMSTMLSALRIHQCVCYCCLSYRYKKMNCRNWCHNAKQPNGVFIVAGDFNQTDLRTVLPKFHQHVHTSTRVRVRVRVSQKSII